MGWTALIIKDQAQIGTHNENEAKIEEHKGRTLAKPLRMGQACRDKHCPSEHRSAE